MSLIELKSLSKAYANGEHQDFILENIDFNISSNDFVGLRGRSGSGKSTLLNIIGLIDDITSGQYFFDGLDLTKMSEFEKTNLRRKNFGFIFQNFNLISSMNVFENIEYPLLLLETSKSQREKLVSDIIDVVGLQGLGRRFPSEISGGQRQRVAIARAIVKKPKIIIADEPTANLDSENANMIGELFQNIYKMNQLTIICCSHDDSLLKSANQVYEIKNRKMSLK